MMGTLQGKSGSLLIVTLWLVVILSVLAVAIARHLSLEVRITKYRMARERARVLARSGVYVAMTRLGQEQSPSESYDWLKSDWAQPPNSDPTDPTKWVLEAAANGPAGATSGNRIEVRMIDEERKLNLNGMPGAGNALFTAVSTLLSHSDELAARIVDYIDPDETPAVFGAAKGLEEDNSKIPPYHAKNSTLAAPEELLEIPGIATMTSTIRTTLFQSTSVYTTADAKLNINTVSPSVLVALGFRPEVAEAMRLCRERDLIFKESSDLLSTAEGCLGPAGLSLSPEERSQLLSVFGVNSHLFTVQSDGIALLSPGQTASPSVRVRVEVVVERSTDPKKTPPKILAWREG